jgi:hypothetical protein
MSATTARLTKFLERVIRDNPQPMVLRLHLVLISRVIVRMTWRLAAMRAR